MDKNVLREVTVQPSISPTREDQAAERSKDKLKRDIDKEITKHMDVVLNLVEVAIGDPHRYKAFRGKFLKSGNNTIREIKKLLDQDYKVMYVPSREDVIQIQTPSVTTKMSFVRKDS